MDRVIDMREKINEVFEALKQLDMKPTPQNVSIMNGVYQFLREIYHEMGEADERAASDSEGRDND